MAKKSNTKRKDGRIAVQVYLGVVDGKKKYKTVYGITYKEAEKKADEVRAKLDRGIDITSNKSLKFATELWLKSVKFAQTDSQYKLYKYRSSYFVDRLGMYDIDKIKLFQLQDIINELSLKNPKTGGKTAHKTLNDYIGTIKQIYDYTILNRMCEYNVALGLKLPKNAPKSHRRALSKEEQQLIINTEHRAKTPAFLAMYAGLRRGEITALLWSDIDFENNFINITKSYDFKNKTIKEPKTKSGIRKVYLIKILKEYLQSLPVKSIYVFPNKKNTIMLEGAWQRLWESYLKALYFNNDDKVLKIYSDEERFTMHYLRHTFCSISYESNVDVLALQKFMGHAKTDTTLNVYTHLSEEKLKNEGNKLDAHTYGVSQMSVNEP